MQISKIGKYYNTLCCGNSQISSDSHKFDYENLKKDYRKSDGLKLIDSYNKPASVMRSELVRERQKLLTPITSVKEYEKVLDEIFKYKYKPNQIMYCKPYICTDGYEAVNDNFKGLIVYCGLDDRSDTINSWLTGRKLPEDTPADDCQIANIIRAMDYSLDRLDETFGKYKGVVYRVGFFNPISDKQFYSTSAESIGAVKHSPDIIPTKENPYAIIKIKNGHNLHAFQKQVNSYFSKRIGETEKEILIDRNSKFRLVPESEYTDTDIRLRNIMLTQAVKNSDEIYGKDIENAVNGHQDLLKYISIWEEI